MYTLLPILCIHAGIGALYKGLLPTVIRAFLANAALFVTYEYTSDFLKYQFGSSTVDVDNS